MNRVAVVAVAGLIAFLASGCGNSSSVSGSTVSDARVSSPQVAASIDTSMLAPRGEGLTLKLGDNAEADLKGGRYRVAWVTTGCTDMRLTWDAGSASTPIPVSLPAGETVVMLPAGPGSLNRAGVCPPGSDFVIRFEAAP